MNFRSLVFNPLPHQLELKKTINSTFMTQSEMWSRFWWFSIVNKLYYVTSLRFCHFLVCWFSSILSIWVGSSSFYYNLAMNISWKNHGISMSGEKLCQFCESRSVTSYSVATWSATKRGQTGYFQDVLETSPWTWVGIFWFQCNV